MWECVERIDVDNEIDSWIENGDDWWILSWCWLNKNMKWEERKRIEVGGMSRW